MAHHMKAISGKNEAELTKLLAEKREELRAFRFGTKGSRTRNTKAGLRARRDIARILTYRRARAV